MEEVKQNLLSPPPAVALSDMITRAGQFAVLGIGLLHATALLIVNLGRYGIVSLDLARPEYIMAGSCTNNVVD